jgi:ankyrin repeat protein
MANVFIHFEPIGPVGEDIKIDPDLPQYVIRGSEEDVNWRRSHPGGYKVQTNLGVTAGTTIAHQAAVIGDNVELKRALEGQADLVNARDDNGWTALHEACRYGKVDTVKLLLEYGADLNVRTDSHSAGGGAGGSPLWWALQYFDEDHEFIQTLNDMGAKNLAPLTQHSEL